MCVVPKNAYILITILSVVRKPNMKSFSYDKLPTSAPLKRYTNADNCWDRTAQLVDPRTVFRRSQVQILLLSVSLFLTLIFENLISFLLSFVRWILIIFADYYMPFSSSFSSCYHRWPPEQISVFDPCVSCFIFHWQTQHLQKALNGSVTCILRWTRVKNKLINANIFCL